MNTTNSQNGTEKNKSFRLGRNLVPNSSDSRQAGMTITLSFSFFFLLCSLLFAPTTWAAKWVTEFTDCGTNYLSIDCEADKYVCGYDGILHCANPEEVNNAKKDTTATINIQSGLGGGLVLNCAAESSSCLPWQCQTDSTCDQQKRSTQCQAEGDFECGECKQGFLDCDDSPDCETPDGAIAGSHAFYDGCDGIRCDSGYLDCNGEVSDGCEIKIGGACQVNGQAGTYGDTCQGDGAPVCQTFAQQYVPIQKEGGETVASKVQIDDDGSINLPQGARFMVAGQEVSGGGANDCSGNQLKLGTQCVNIPSCEDGMKFQNGQFSCVEIPEPVAQDKLYPGDCLEGQIRIGGQCQPVPTCDLLRFDSANGKFLCATMPEQTASQGEASSPLADLDCQSGQVLSWNGSSWTCTNLPETSAEYTSTGQTVDREQIRQVVNEEFTTLANTLEQNFTQMLTQVQQQVASGIKSGKIVAVEPNMPQKKEPSAPSSSGTEEKTGEGWFKSVVQFFQGLFE